MYHYSVKDLDHKRMYKLLSGSLIPRPIGWITTINTRTGTLNAAPFSFTSAASNEVALLTMAILRKDGQPKDTAHNLLENGNGVVHIVSEDLVEMMNRTSAPLAPDESEIALTDLTLADSVTVTTPGIAEAKIRMEVTVYDYHPVKDREGKIVTDFFFLEVTDFYFAESVFDPEKEYIDAETLRPVARLSGPLYATLAKQYELKRPE